MLLLGDAVLHVLPAKKGRQREKESKASEMVGTSLSAEAISRCVASAGTEAIRSVQGRADKEHNIITSPYGLRLFDPICECWRLHKFRGDLEVLHVYLSSDEEEGTADSGPAELLNVCVVTQQDRIVSELMMMMMSEEDKGLQCSKAKKITSSRR